MISAETSTAFLNIVPAHVQPSGFGAFEMLISLKLSVKFMDVFREFIAALTRCSRGLNDDPRC